MATMVSVVKLHRSALRAIVGLGVLTYGTFTLMYFNSVWRDRAAHYVGALMLMASFPWSLIWLLGVEPHVINALPRYVVAATRVLVVGLGLGLNLAIVASVVWWLRDRVRLGGASIHDA
jgi:hypothetical protein